MRRRPGVYHGGWGGQQPPPSNAFFAAPDQVFESPAQNKAAPRNTASPDLFGDSVAPSTVSSGEKKKAAKNFDFGLHSELVSLDLNANGAPPKAKSAIKRRRRRHEQDGHDGAAVVDEHAADGADGHVAADGYSGPPRLRAPDGPEQGGCWLKPHKHSPGGIHSSNRVER